MIGREILRADKIETGQHACCVTRANESSAGACTGSGLQRGRASPCSDAGLPVAAEPLWKNFDNGSITPVTPSSPIGRLPSSLAIERRRSSVRRHRIWANGREDHHAIAFVARAPFRLSIRLQVNRRLAHFEIRFLQLNRRPTPIFAAKS
jgi:hypothetical protein